MFRANRSVWILTIGLVIWLSATQLAQAGRRNHARGWWTRSLPAQTGRTTPANSYNKYTNRFPDNDWYYPRYTGAFHARYFDEMRYPTGDRGIRGTAW